MIASHKTNTPSLRGITLGVLLGFAALTQPVSGADVIQVNFSPTSSLLPISVGGDGFVTTMSGGLPVDLVFTGQLAGRPSQRGFLEIWSGQIKSTSQIPITYGTNPNAVSVTVGMEATRWSLKGEDGNYLLISSSSPGGSYQMSNPYGTSSGTFGQTGVSATGLLGTINQPLLLLSFQPPTEISLVGGAPRLMTGWLGSGYVKGNLTPVPEPSTYVMGAIAVSFCVAIGYRNRLRR